MNCAQCYTNCLLIREEGGRRCHRTCWIPNEFAIEKNVVKTKDDEESWTVLFVYSTVHEVIECEKMC